MSTDPMGQYYSPYLAMGNNPIERIDPDGGKDGTDPTYDSKQTLEVTVSAKKLNSYGRMSLRTELGLNPYQYSSGKTDYEAMYTKDTYARVKWGKDPQWYLIEGAMYLQGAGEIAEGAYWDGKAIYAGGKYLANRFVLKQIGTVVGEIAAKGECNY